MATATYTTPELRDYGSLAELTRFQGFFGTEDGASKAIPLHHNPSAPCQPGDPGCGP